jgi:hypothetical protein
MHHQAPLATKHLVPFHKAGVQARFAAVKTAAPLRLASLAPSFLGALPVRGQDARATCRLAGLAFRFAGARGVNRRRGNSGLRLFCHRCAKRTHGSCLTRIISGAAITHKTFDRRTPLDQAGLL